MEEEKINYALEQIPENQKRGWVAMFSVLVAIGVDLSSVILGAELAQSMPMKQAILSVIVGSFFLQFCILHALWLAHLQVYLHL